MLGGAVSFVVFCACCLTRSAARAGQAHTLASHTDVGGPDYLGTLVLERTDRLCGRLLDCAHSRYRWSDFLAQYYSIVFPGIKSFSFIEASIDHYDCIAFRTLASSADETRIRLITQSPPRSLKQLATLLEPFRLVTPVRTIPANVLANVGWNGFHLRGSMSAHIHTQLFPRGWSPDDTALVDNTVWRSRPCSREPRYPPPAFVALSAAAAASPAPLAQTDERAQRLPHRKRLAVALSAPLSSVSAAPAPSSSPVAQASSSSSSPSVRYCPPDSYADDESESDESGTFADQRRHCTSVFDAVMALTRRSVLLSLGANHADEQLEEPMPDADVADDALSSLMQRRHSKPPARYSSKEFEKF